MAENFKRAYIMRRSIAVAGTSLIVVGSIFLIFGLWYAWMYGISTDKSIRNLFFPEWAGDLLSLIGGGCSMIVLGIIFVLWAYKLSKQSKNKE